MTTTDTKPDIGFLLSDTGRMLRKRFNQRARGHATTRAQWRVLFNLARVPGMNQARLADQLEIEPITLCRLIDRMEEAGWVRREADPRDRRARLLFITGEAEPLLDELRRLAGEVNAEALAGISPAALEQCVATIRKIHANLSEGGKEA